MTSETRQNETRALPGETRGRLAGLAMAAIGASILLTITIGLLGPSPMVPALIGPAWHPPFSLDIAPEPHLVVILATAALILGGLGLLTALTTMRAPGNGTSRAGLASGARLSPTTTRLSALIGYFPSTKALVLIGCTAAGILAFLPPSGSGDHLNYAAYGRMVTLGLNPYTHGAVDLPGDPIADAVEDPWREEPSVYGPVATALQAVASWVGGDSLRLTIFVLALFNAAAFIATGLLIDRFTRDDPTRRRRAALLWTANPLLLYQLVAGMHVDTLAIACMVAALLARSRPVGSGILLGLGVAIKVNAGLVALGPAWELRRRPARLALMAGCAVAVVVVGYAIAGTDAIAPITRTSKSVSLASFWKLVQGWLQTIVGTGSAYRGEIQIGSLLVLALIAWCLLRRQGPLTSSRDRRTIEAPEGASDSQHGEPQGPSDSQNRDLRGMRNGSEEEPREAPADREEDLRGTPNNGDGHLRGVSADREGASEEFGVGREPDVRGVPGELGMDPREGVLDGSGGGILARPDGRKGPGGAGLEATVVAAGLMVAYVFATPYVLPWYDGLAFGLLALIGASALDRFVVAHLLILSLAYLPARVNGQPEDLSWLTEVVRPQLAWALLALTVALVVWALRVAGRERRLRASAERPPSTP